MVFQFSQKQSKRMPIQPPGTAPDIQRIQRQAVHKNGSMERRGLLSIINTKAHTKPIIVGTIIFQMITIENRQNHIVKRRRVWALSFQILGAIKDRV